MDPDFAIPGAIAIAAFVQGYGGFGFGIIAMALVSIVSGNLEASSSVIMIASTILVLWLLKLSWKDGTIDWPNIGRLFFGALIGLPFGYIFLIKFGDLPIGRIALGVVLVGFCIVGLFSGREGLRMKKFFGIPMGILSGFVGGAFVSGGPPVIVYLYGQTKDPRSMKPTIQIIFLIMLLMRLIAAGTTGALWDFGVLKLSAISLPLAALLLTFGHWLSSFVSAKIFRLAVQGLIGLFGVLLILLNWRPWWETLT
jgi:uncharacterized protein